MTNLALDFDFMDMFLIPALDIHSRITEALLVFISNYDNVSIY